MSVRTRLNDYLNQKPIDYEKASQEVFYFHASEEGGYRHPSGASLRFKGNGDIELFAKGYSGFVAREAGKSFNVFGEKINLHSEKEVRINTGDNGFLWNGNVFNSDMFDTEFLIANADIRKALTLLLNGGIAVTTPSGPGATNAIGGTIESMRPFLYNKKPKVMSDYISDMVNEISKGAI